MKNSVQNGKVLNLTAPTGGVVSGNAYLIGGLLAVAQTTQAVGELFAGVTEGVIELPKENTTAVFTEGEAVYWDDTAKELDESASGRYEVGTATEAAGATAATVKVKLKGFAVAAVP